MRPPYWLLFAATPLLGCWCGNPFSPCMEMTESMVVFVGRVISDPTTHSKQNRYVKMAVEQPLLNMKEGIAEIQVESICCIPFLRHFQ